MAAMFLDESRDCSNKEQMPLIVRYVNDTSEIQESFLAFVECEHGTFGEQVVTLIENTCLRLGLDLRQCRGQGFDGASNMAGAVNGADSRIRSKFPKALYFHCVSHKLNLFFQLFT